MKKKGNPTMSKLLFMSESIEEIPYTSFILERNGFTILVDVTPDVLAKLDSHKIKKIDAIFLTSSAWFSTGGIPEFSKWTEENITVYSTEDIWRNFIVDDLKRDHLSFIAVEPGKTFQLSDLNITPFGVGEDSLGFRIGGVVVAQSLDIAEMGHIESNPEVLILGMYPLDTLPLLLDIAKKANATEVYFTPGEGDSSEYIAKIKSLKRERKLTCNFTLIEDGMSVRKVTRTLSAQGKVIRLSQTQLDKVLKDKHKCIILNEKIASGSEYLSVDGNIVGVGVFSNPTALDLTSFRKTIDQHGMGDMVRKKLFGAEDKLYMYDFELIEAITPTKEEIISPTISDEIEQTLINHLSASLRKVLKDLGVTKQLQLNMKLITPIKPFDCVIPMVPVRQELTLGDIYHE